MLLNIMFFFAHFTAILRIYERKIDEGKDEGARRESNWFHGNFENKETLSTTTMTFEAPKIRDESGVRSIRALGLPKEIISADRGCVRGVNGVRPTKRIPAIRGTKTTSGWLTLDNLRSPQTSTGEASTGFLRLC